MDPRPGVVLSLRLARLAVSSGSATRGALRIDNGSDRELRISPACDPVEHGLYVHGNWLGGDDFNWGCPADYNPDNDKIIAPGDSLEFPFALTALRASDENYQRHPLPSGPYGATAGIANPDGDGFWFAPVRVVSIPAEPPLPGTTNSESPTFQPPSGLRLELTLAAPRVPRGGTVSGTLTVTNGSRRTIRFSTGCGQWWGLYSSSGVLMGGRKDYGCSSSGAISSLDAGQTVVLEVTFDTSSHRHHIKAPDEQLPPGTYLAACGIYSLDDQEPWATPPIEIVVS